MALVNYGSSSESEDSDHEIVQSTKRSISSVLPKKTVYVDLPSFQDDDDQPQPKRAKTTTGLSLADLLPKPKNTTTLVPVTKTTTDKAFMPHALAKKLKGKAKETTPPPAAEEEKEKEEEEEEEEEVKVKTKPFIGSFFRVGKDLKEMTEPTIVTTKKTMTVEKPVIVEKEPIAEEPQYTAVDAYAYDPNAMYSTDPSVYSYYQQEYYQQQEAEQMENLIGDRRRGEGSVQFRTVNQNDMLLSDEVRAAQALTSAPKFESGITMQASKLQMKKNNIMALAAHAVNNQQKLDEMFAANKKTRRDASKKYGF